ncbi:unnamed protein product [Closterium sp. NIES-54]
MTSQLAANKALFQARALLAQGAGRSKREQRLLVRLQGHDTTGYTQPTKKYAGNNSRKDVGNIDATPVDGLCDISRTDLAALRDRLNEELLRQETSPVGSSAELPHEPNTLADPVAIRTAVEGELVSDSPVNANIGNASGPDKAQAEVAHLMGNDGNDQRRAATGKKLKPPTRQIPVNDNVAVNRNLERTVAQQAEVVATLCQQLEEQMQEAERMRLLAASAPLASTSATTGSGAPSPSQSHRSMALGDALPRSQRGSNVPAMVNAVVPAPIIRDGANISSVLLDLSFKLKCNAAVNYFISGAAVCDQSFYPELTILRRKVQELYEEVGVSAEMINRVMADNPKCERISFQKMSERKCNVYSATKP